MEYSHVSRLTSHVRKTQLVRHSPLAIRPFTIRPAVRSVVPRVEGGDFSTALRTALCAEIRTPSSVSFCELLCDTGAPDSSHRASEFSLVQYPSILE